jgi:Carboxypeptidase regulatory-like domain
MWRASLVMLFLSTCTAVGVAQDKALISGDTEDLQDVPVSGVQVTLQNPSLRVERTTTTNSDGFYFFAEVSPADGYVITASAPGMTFAPQSVKFDVEVGETRHILPSFVAQKPGAPVSSLRGLRPPDGSDCAERDGVDIRPVVLAKRPVQSASTPLESLQITAAGLPSSIPDLRAVPDRLRRHSASGRPAANDLAECRAEQSTELKMKRAPGCNGRGILT